MDWKMLLESEMQKKYMLDLQEKLNSDYQTKKVYPPKDMVFKALDLTPFDSVRVVILGQDPYHNPKEAMGLSFSVQEGIKMPPSLLNIFKELKLDLGVDMPKSGDLSNWAKQGVLLLNTTLTVEENRPMSHKDYGWTFFTDRIINELNKKETPCVFILWGAHAQSKKVLIDSKRHLVIESAHPSPLSAHRGFFGSKPFSRTNAFLEKNHLKPINWSL